MTLLHIIRHGKPSAVWGGGDDDPGLDPPGMVQASHAADSLLGLPASERPTKVASSPLRRCRETAAPLADALGVSLEIVPEVGEIPTPGTLDPAARGAWLRKALAGTWSDIQGDLDYEAWRRTVWEAVRSRPGVAIFSHFVAINAVLSLVQDQDRVIGFRPDHASITTLDAADGRLGLVRLGSEASTGIL
jgi:broad specificity phosphatase PhoE